MLQLKTLAAAGGPVHQNSERAGVLHDLIQLLCDILLHNQRILWPVHRAVIQPASLLIRDGSGEQKFYHGVPEYKVSTLQGFLVKNQFRAGIIVSGKTCQIGFHTLACR